MSFFSSSLAEEIVTPLKNSNVDNERNVRDSSISEYFEDVDAEFYKHAGLERYGEESAAEPAGRDLSPRRSRELYGGDGAREAAGTDDDAVNDDSGLEMRRKPQLETPCVGNESGVTTTFCSESEKVVRAHPSKSLYDDWSCDEDLDDNRQQNYGKKKKRGKKLLPKLLTRKRNHPNSNQASSSTSSSHPPENHETLHRHEQEEVDIGWKIMMFLLKTWFVIWVLFAIAAIATSLSHPHHPRKKVLSSQTNRDVPFDINQVHDSVIAAAAAGNADLENNTITNNYEMNDEQILMVISEQIITTCSTQNLVTEKGRAECQMLCHGHMCCFMDDEDDDDVLVEMVESLGAEERKSYGCANDPEKMCAVYAGCEALVEDVDAPFSNTHHFDNEEMTKRPEREGGENDTKASENYSFEESSTQQQQQQQQQNSEQDQQHIIDATISSSTTSNPDTTNPPNSELQLISEVITQTCSNENLHTRQGMLGCASLCQQSICCFDPNEIHELNPNMDLILRMEGVTDKLLNRTAMGTCTHEEEGEKGDFTSNHFCNIHKGCKNLLLFGKHSNPSHSKLKKKPPPSALEKGNSPIYLGVSSTNDSNDNEEDEGDNEWRYLVTYFFLFGIVIAITTYLLVFNRHASSMTFDIANTLREEGKSMDDYDDEIRQEMTEFV